MKRKKLNFFLLGAGVLLSSILLVVLLIVLQPSPEAADTEIVPPLVTATTPTPHKGNLVVRGFGTVRPLQEIAIITEVSGRITWASEDFVSGGLFREGEPLLRIDATSYENALTIAQAEVLQRQFDVLITEQEVALAKQEWELLEERTGAERKDETALGSFVFKEPQQQIASALLSSAQAHLEDAQSRLERTQITAPFNGRIRSKSVDVGQYIGTGQVVASFFGTDAAEIDVSVPASDIALLGDVFGRRQPAAASVIVDGPFGRYEWPGIVHRAEGALREASRTLTVVVRVSRPYQTDEGQPPLIMGSFVTVEMEGLHLDQYFGLPRATLREDNQIYLVQSGRLQIRRVQVLQEVEDTIYLAEGVAETDSVVTSALPVAVDGMPVRVMTQDLAGQ